MTHLLLTTLVAGALDAGLALLVVVAVLVVDVAAGTALDAGHAAVPLALRNTIAHADGTRRTDGQDPASVVGHGRTAVHAGETARGRGPGLGARRRRRQRERLGAEGDRGGLSGAVGRGTARDAAASPLVSLLSFFRWAQARAGVATWRLRLLIEREIGRPNAEAGKMDERTRLKRRRAGPGLAFVLWGTWGPRELALAHRHPKLGSLFPLSNFPLALAFWPPRTAPRFCSQRSSHDDNDDGDDDEPTGRQSYQGKAVLAVEEWHASHC